MKFFNATKGKQISKRLLVLAFSTGVGILALGASSARADVRLKFADGSQGLLWRDGFNLIYKLCAGDAPASRDCLASIGPLTIPQITYEPAVRRQFNLEGTPYAAQNGMVKLQGDIKDLEAAVKDPNLSADELAKAQEKLMILKRCELDLMLVNGLLSHLDTGNDVTYDQAFSENFTKIVAPFKELGNPGSSVPTGLVSVADLGLVAKQLDAMCWADAAGKKRDVVCQHAAVQKGCVLTLGRQWRLPSMAEALSLKMVEQTSGSLHLDRINAIEGPSRYHPSYGGTSYFEAEYTYGNQSQIASRETICVARARDVDPNGDVDGDGIPNGIDKCNKQPNDLTAPVNQSGPYVGCAAGQTPDEPVVIDNPGTNGDLDNILSARLTRNQDGRLMIFVDSNRLVNAMGIVGVSASPFMLTAGGSGQSVSEFYTYASEAWADRTKIKLQVTFNDGSTITDEIPLNK